MVWIRLDINQGAVTKERKWRLGQKKGCVPCILLSGHLFRETESRVHAEWGLGEWALGSLPGLAKGGLAPGTPSLCLFWSHL